MSDKESGFAGDYITLCALWENTSKSGNRYLSGKLNNMKIMMFPNKNKKSDKHPDWTIVVPRSQVASTGKGAGTGQAGDNSGGGTSSVGPDADVPF
jgi:uncharacterized protein (DUF736 family)